MILLPIQWILTPKVLLGIVCELDQPELEPEPNLRVLCPTPVTNDNEDGEDVTGPMVEAHFEFTKTIGKQPTMLDHGWILMCTWSSMHQSWYTDQRPWWTSLSLSPTMFSWRPAWSGCHLLSIYLYTWQNLCLFICRRHFPHTKWFMWDRHRAPWTYSCSLLLEAWQTPIQLYFGQCRWTSARYAWNECHSC